MKITTAADFNGVLHVRLHNLSGKIGGRLNSSYLYPVAIKSGKQYSSAHKRIRDVSKLKRWMIDM